LEERPQSVRNQKTKMSSKSGNNVARNLGLKLKRGNFNDDAFHARTPQTMKRPASDFAYSSTVQGTRVIRYDENGKVTEK
jgi:hypothetical protein